MYEITKIIDCSVWTGNWPFIHLRYREIGALKAKLESSNVVKAFVAPIEGIFEQDPMRANRQLLADIDGSFFSPVPIIDLSYDNWEECLDLAVQDKRVHMVKLLPNYHRYALDNERVKDFVKLTQLNNLIVSIQIRVEDIRGQYPPLKVADVKVDNDLLMTLAQFPEQMFLLSNFYLHELVPEMKAFKNIYLDISSMETQDTLQATKNIFSLDRVLFSSHLPFFYPEGNIAKLKFAIVDASEVDKVAYGNAMKLFKII